MADAIIEAESHSGRDAAPDTLTPSELTSSKPSQPEAHPLVQLAGIFEAASRHLCFRLTSEAEAEVERLTAEARALEVPEPPDYKGWAKHYRLKFDALDLAHLRQPLEAPGSYEPVVFATAAGADLPLAGVQAAAEQLKAEAVFFVAADDIYVAKHAQLYVLSVLKNVDIPALVIVHVIGGAGRLRAIAESLAIHDPRLIYAADAFDAHAVATRTHQTPPRNETLPPTAHFQSARFQHLSGLLRALKRPMFVSDIDLLLQRGVSDLLAQHQGADVVLNENIYSTSACSRLTANLVLVFPTPNALVFVDFLESYLKRMLNRADVICWVDQCGLLMAYHALVGSHSDADVRYFDTSLDINNIIYRTYTYNPFRFLSLYCGFDMTSLDAQRQSLVAHFQAQ